jgi:putative SbcD/Mre11-related phosphoesterase
MDPAADLTFDDGAVVCGETVVVADLHVGRGSASAVDLPVGDGADTVARLEGVCERHEPETVVLAGDVLHAFDTVPHTVERTLDGLWAVAEGVDAEIVVTPGNHDTLLETVWEGPTTEQYRMGETVVVHGHEEPTAAASRYLVGHDHPALEIEGQKRSCYLVGEAPAADASLVMLPAFNRLVRGVTVNDMRASEFQCPLVTDLDRLAPSVLTSDGRDTLSFPPLADLRPHL